MTLVYRTAQFLRSLTARAGLGQLTRAWPYLTAGQRELFFQLPAADQLHALRVLGHLLEAGEKDPDLLAAALLHDIGKLKRPLRVWERAFIVVAQTLGSKGNPAGPSLQGPGWRQALAVGAHHPAWGGDMLREAGANPRLVELVERHQDPSSPPSNEFERLLVKLQQADNLS